MWTQLTNSSIFPPTGCTAQLRRWLPSDDGEVMRCCYVTQEVESFLALPAIGAATYWSYTLSPKRQLMNKLDAFVEGDHWAVLAQADTPPAFRKLRPRRPEGPNAWELRTIDVRLFGWFPGPPNTFVGVVPALKRDLVDQNGMEDDAKYRSRIDDVVRFRAAHGLEAHIWRLAQDDLPNHLKC